MSTNEDTEALPDELPSGVQKLREARQQIDAGKTVVTSVRLFLDWFGYARRGRAVIRQIRDALHENQLQTTPDFEYAWIDEVIRLIRTDVSDVGGTQSEASTAGNETTVITPIAEDVPDVAVPRVSSNSYADPMYRIGKLPFANRVPVSIHPDRDVTEALTLMLRHDYSQLPVMTSERDVKGVISWKSVAMRAKLGPACVTVRDCMSEAVEVFDNDASLFRVIHAIVEHECILVRDKTRKITGVVTASDLSETFHQLGRPFLLLGEIENLIRGMLDGKFTKEELQGIRNGDEGRTVADVSDLTFGEYVRLIQEPDRWNRLGLKIDRATFVKDLEKVNGIRNDVMHFDPEGITNEELDELRKTAKFLQEVKSAHQPSETGR